MKTDWTHRTAPLFFKKKEKKKVKRADALVLCVLTCSAIRFLQPNWEYSFFFFYSRVTDTVQEMMVGEIIRDRPTDQCDAMRCDVMRCHEPPPPFIFIFIYYFTFCLFLFIFIYRTVHGPVDRQYVPLPNVSSRQTRTDQARP